MDLHPDMIILQFCLNDVVERYSSLAHYGGDTMFLGVDTRDMIPGLHGWFIRNSKAYEALVRTLVKLARNQQEYEVQKLFSERLSPELERAWEITLSEIDEINSIAVENNIPFLIVIAPYRFQLDGHLPQNQPQKKLMGYCNENGIDVLDLLPFFLSFQKERKEIPLFYDANHFSTNGHYIASLAVLKKTLSIMEKEFAGNTVMTE
jgi:hypothetical protein